MRVVAANTAGRRSGRQPGVVVLAEQMPVVRVLLGDADPLAAQAITSLLDAAAEVSVIGCESAQSPVTASSYNSGDQTTSFTPSGQGSTAATYGGNGQGDRLSFGTTTIYANGLQGLLSATTSGASTYYERDPSGTLISERGPGGEFYYVTDGLGSTVALVDTTGTVQATDSYDPYGNATSVGGPNLAIANGNPFRYAGGYYDTTTGRWTQQDSLNTPLDPTNGNRYAYTGDDPTNGIDLQGLGAYDPNGCTSPARYDVSQEIPPPQDAPISIDCTLAIIGLAGTGIGYATGPITFGASAIAAGFGTAGVISVVREC